MSHYLLRQDRKRLKKKIAYMERAHEFALGEAHAETAEALRALARARYDQPVRWDSGGLPVVYEQQPRVFPAIALRLFAYRERIDVGMFPPGLRDELVKRVERIAAERIAREMIAKDLVSIDRAAVPIDGNPNVLEFDWGVYVGLPVKKDPNARHLWTPKL